MGIISLLISVKRDGPVLFTQKRIGQHRVPFKLFKFRTMVHRKAEDIDQFKEPILTTGNDIRLTPVGRILRTTSLDELPQIFNVLNGTMSLIGPRPLMPEQLLAVPVQFEERFSVRPGITGWAQINGRQSVDWLKKLEADTWYARNNNLQLDLQILFKTIRVVFQGLGVYGNAKDNWRNYVNST